MRAPAPTGAGHGTPAPLCVPSATRAGRFLGTPGKIRFAVIGDYGSAGPNEAAVANLVNGWDPDLVITTGDNNYPSGGADTIDANIGQYYHAFIGGYAGTFGCGAAVNRFFSALGNHDWYSGAPKPYTDYFQLPGNERYYDVVVGDVHLFAIDSDSSEPDGVASDSVQAIWLKGRLASSTAIWKVVYMHHPPYSSGPHQSSAELRWPFKEWGARLVFAGHDHDYERLNIGGLPYIVDGLGGASRYAMGAPLPGSRARFDAEFGAVLVEADAGSLTSQFFTAEGRLIDQLMLTAKP